MAGREGTDSSAKSPHLLRTSEEEEGESPLTMASSA